MRRQHDVLSDQPSRRHRRREGHDGIGGGLAGPGAEGVVGSGFGRTMMPVAAGQTGMPEHADSRQHDERRIAQREQHSRQDKSLSGESWVRHHRFTATFA